MRSTPYSAAASLKPIPGGDFVSPYGDYNAQISAFWRTLVADRRDCGTQSSAREPIRWPVHDNGAIYEVYIGRAEVRQTESKSKFLRDFLHSSAKACTSRALYITQKGLFGLGPKGAKPGDQVVVVPGMSIPLLLRPRRRGEKYQFLGPAYVHGIMDGVVVEIARSTGRLDNPHVFEID